MKVDPATLPLRDIHLPDPVSWWPLAPGWWFSLLFLLLLVGVAWAIRRWIKRGQLKRSALAELKLLEQTCSEDGEDSQQQIEALSILLRRLALSVYPRQEIASLTGEQWLLQLDVALATTPQSGAFSAGIGRVIIEAPYKPGLSVDLPALLALVRYWIPLATRKGGLR